ncbi:MAG: hypothetical protein CMN30_04440 [Sandaracinus sp.]|nr:hypothetical protein [Sandaracinus sp.]
MSKGRQSTESVPETEEPLSPGSYLGPGLRFVRELGAGGQGRVLLAEDEHLARPVAVKFLGGDAGARMTPEIRGRLRVEARAMARVRHPSVVQVFDLGEAHQRPYLVMEFVPGETMERRIRAHTEALSLAESLPLLAQIAEGLQAVHEAGLAHGDLQPTNVLIGQDQKARVADFGLAFLSGGTAHYMAPELQSPGPHEVSVRQRADLYAFGALAHEILAGERPFEAPDRARVLVQHVHKAAPLIRSRRHEVPDSLAQVVDACLAKDPADRPAKAADLAETVAAAMAGMRRPSFRRVLIVDDDPHFRALARAYVEDAFEEIHIVEADGGESAMEACARETFDAVILDLHMPGVDGLQLATNLRAEAAPPKLLVMTGKGSARDWALLHSLGVSSFLAKPLEPDQLHAELRRLLYES